MNQISTRQSPDRQTTTKQTSTSGYNPPEQTPAKQKPPGEIIETQNPRQTAMRQTPVTHKSKTARQSATTKTQPRQKPVTKPPRRQTG